MFQRQTIMDSRKEVTAYAYCLPLNPCLGNFGRRSLLLLNGVEPGDLLERSLIVL